ncbi:MAG: secretin and TonB N-terminal domain-containing protein, partial [Muribaculaceae bacterium]|nr:secretin and TonB N-terminal domain-containing protein [Muribaculaceae bacterium]
MIKRAVQNMSCHLKRARAIMLMLAIAVLWGSIPAHAQSGKVTINADGQTLESVLKKIEQQTDYRFFYSRDVVDAKMPVTLRVSDANLSDALAKLFENKDIKYVVDKKQIILSKAAATAAAPKGGASVLVKGTVVDDQGDPLIGVSVTPTGSNTGTTTNIDGNYALRVPVGSRLTVGYGGC